MSHATHGTTPDSTSDTARKPWLAVVLSLLCTGLGHVYCGRLARGLAFLLLSLALTSIGAAFVLAPPSNEMFRLLVAAPVASALLLVVASIDAWRIARGLRTDFTPCDFQRPAVYAVFVVASLVWSGASAGVLLRSVRAYKIPTASMAPTIAPGDRVLANLRRLGQRDVRRGDVVLYLEPDVGRTYIKRVIGLPGERVAIEGGRVVVDGTPLLAERVGSDEAGLFRERSGERSWLVTPGALDFPETTVPERSYLVVGDNRDSSRDSRHTGAVPRTSILGVAEYRFWCGDAHGRIGALGDE